MRIIKAAFSKTFPITQYYEKIYLEAELNEGDDARQVLYDLKKQVQSFFYESNAAAEKQIGSVVKTIEPFEWEPEYPQSMQDQINSCTDRKVLESYKFIVKQNPDLQSAYDQRLNELP